MPIESIPPNDRTERFVASAGQTVFPFDFPIYAAGDIEVRRLRAGAESVLVLGTHYAVAGAGEQAGGTVTLTAGALAGDVIALRSAQAVARTTKLTDGGDLPAAALNAEFNRLVIAIQQATRTLGAALRAAETDTLPAALPPQAERAGKFLGFDAQGNPLAAVLTLGGGTVSAFAAQLLDDADAAAARATIGALARGGDAMAGPLDMAGNPLTVAAPTAAAQAARRDTLAWERLVAPFTPAGAPIWIEIALPPDMAVVEIDLADVGPAATAALVVQGSVDGGATWLASAGAYNGNSYGTAGAATGVLGPAGTLSYSVLAAAPVLSARIRARRSQGSGWTQIRSDSDMAESSTGQWQAATHTTRAGAPFNRLRLAFNGTTWLNRGVVTVAGMRAA